MFTSISPSSASTFVANPNCFSSNFFAPNTLHRPHYLVHTVTTPPRHATNNHYSLWQARISDSLRTYRIARLQQSALSTTATSNKNNNNNISISSGSSSSSSSSSSSTKLYQEETEDEKEERQKQTKASLTVDTKKPEQSTRNNKSKNIKVQQQQQQQQQKQQQQYNIQIASHSELYTAADIRCEAFYNSPNDVGYHPIRRREIYMAIQMRVNAGTKCIVMMDTNPPWYWQSLAGEQGLAVATLDVTFLNHDTGKRVVVSDDPGCDNSHSCAYISSMAVRQGWRGKQLAQQLLAYTSNLVCQKYGVPHVYLHVEWENQVAVHVYSKHGFRPINRPIKHWVHSLAKPEHTLMYLPVKVNNSSQSFIAT